MPSKAALNGFIRSATNIYFCNIDPQIVTYHAGEGGFVADVKYEGSPVVYEAAPKPAYVVPATAYLHA
jgi:hypothetical protein